MILKIFYIGSLQDGLQYYFTKNAIWIKHINTVNRSKNEIKAAKKTNETKEEDFEEQEFAYKQVDEFHQMLFKGGGALTKIEASGMTDGVNNFSCENNTTISARSFNTIIYKNLYPGIDMEFYFPKDKQGFKYNFIIHSGADASVIKIEYPLAKKVELNEDGNIVIQSLYGIFIDHAPMATELITSRKVDCKFIPSKNTVSFSSSTYDKSHDLIIDPWTTTPAFTANNAYDVDFDKLGNCYIYGGRFPFQVIKYNSSGIQQWSFSTSMFSQGSPMYGDFAVDRNTGSVYAVEGVNMHYNGGIPIYGGAEIVKINQAGNQVAFFSGNLNFQEMWRIAFDYCSNRAVIAGGGTTSPSYTGCSLDTNLTSINPVSVVSSPNGYHDIWGLTLDNFDNCYMATSKSTIDSTSPNMLLKVPFPALTPNNWRVSTKYIFNEGTACTYYPGIANGYNGITVMDTFVYTYDSYVLKKWNTSNGVLIDSLIVNNQTNRQGKNYGGLATDGCSNLFVGLKDSIVQYDANFHHLNSFKAPDSIFDVVAGNNLLYVCGKGFVSTISPNTPCNFCSQTTDIKNGVVSQHLFTVWPNPVNTILNIEYTYPNNILNYEVSIFNAIGEVVNKSILLNTKNQITVDLSSLSNGIYLIQVKNPENVFTKKIIVQH